jgi:hypothetical protein
VIRPTFQQVKTLLLDEAVDTGQTFRQNLPGKVVDRQFGQKIFAARTKQKSGDCAKPLDVNIESDGFVVTEHRQKV